MQRYPETLWKLLKNQNLGLAKRLEIAIKLAKEVKSAHKDSMMVHKDLKPTNVMLDANQELTLVDFGIARNIGFWFELSGTPGFNAPEAFSGDKQQYSADIFSLAKNLILILFKWDIGWTLLWSPKEWITSQKISEDKLAPFSDFFDLIRQMLQVNLKDNLF